MSARSSPIAADGNDLLAWAADPAAAARFSALAGCSCLVFGAGRAGIDARDRPRVARWLQGLACPVIAVGMHDDELASACDARVEHPDDAQPLLRSIERAPLAAAVLVQVLRAVGTLSVDQGLLVESLAYSTLQAGAEFGRWRETYVPSTPAPAPAPDTGPAVLVQRESASLRLELNRPSRRNAMSVEMRDALIESLQLVLADDTICALEIRGRGRCFSTGGDVAEFGSAPDAATAHLVRCLALPGRLLESCRERASVFVHGACVGSGIEFPAFAARLVATPDAWFQLPELRYGLIPGAGGCISISRRIGRQRTAWMALSGDKVSAKTALEWGLVDAIEARAQETARQAREQHPGWRLP